VADFCPKNMFEKLQSGIKKRSTLISKQLKIAKNMHKKVVNKKVKEI
jgi:hypothetical protein